MEQVSQRTVKATPIVEIDEPSKHQYLANQGRRRSPPLRRVIVYNRAEKSMEVRSEKKMLNCQQFPLLSFHPTAKARITVSEREASNELLLPRRQSIITVFVDPETESKPTTESTDQEGFSNLLLTKLRLDRLGTMNRMLRFFGFITSVYVTNVEPQWSESPTPRIECA